MNDQHIVRRNRNRGHYDLETARAVLDAGVVCHVGICDGGKPVVIPMLYARDGDHLLLHGAVASRLLRRLAEGLIPGRSRDARAANPKEMNATTILRLPLETFSVKIRTGGPDAPGPDDPQDLWTGVVPLHQTTGEPEGEGGAKLPDYLKSFRVAGRRGRG